MIQKLRKNLEDIIQVHYYVRLNNNKNNIHNNYKYFYYFISLIQAAYQFANENAYSVIRSCTYVNYWYFNNKDAKIFQQSNKNYVVLQFFNK